MGRRPTPGAPALVSDLCGAVRAPGDRGVGRPSWGGLGARWAARLRGGQGGRPGPPVAMETGRGRQPRPGGRGSRWRDGAPAGGGAGRGPRGAAAGGALRGASPPPACFPAPAAPWATQALPRSLQLGLQSWPRLPLPVHLGYITSSTLSLLASVSPTVEWRSCTRRFSCTLQRT